MKKNILLPFWALVNVFNLVAMHQSPVDALNLQLCEAVRDSDLTKATNALDQGAEVDCEFDPGVDISSPLAEAVKNNNPYSQNNAQIIDLLIDRGADLDILAAFGHEDEFLPPLFIATLKSDKLTAKKLLDHGAQMFFVDDIDVITGIETILARYNNTFMLRFFMENGFDINKKLLEAIKYNQGVVPFLLQNGANPNFADPETEKTPILYACENEKPVLVKMLVEHGADINFADPETGKTPILYACENENKLLVKMLVEHGADIHKSDHWGVSPLILASEAGLDAVVKCFVQRGADISMRDNDGSTALLKACFNGHVGVVNYLRDWGAVLDDKDLEGKTSLMWAISSGSLEMVKYLLEHDVKKDALDNCGRTALTYAAIKGYLPIFQMLQDAGLDKHDKCSKGKDMLMYAAKNGHMALVSWLLFDVHDMQVRDNKGRTAYDIAYQEKEKMIGYLQNAMSEYLQNAMDQEEDEYYVNEMITQSQNANNVVNALSNPEVHLKENRKLFKKIFRRPILSKFTKGHNIVNALHTRSLGQKISIKRIKPRILRRPLPDQNAPW